MKPPPFRYERPTTLAGALDVLAEHGDEARPLAGGQSFVPMLNLRLAAPGVVVDLNGLTELDGLTLADGRLAVGALTRQRTLELSPEAAGIGALADGLPLIGHAATRNRGTVGGSIAHADPAAELPLALLAVGGSVMAATPQGRRDVAAAEFFTGFLTTALQPGEIVTEVRFPAPQAGDGSALVEVAQRHGDFPLAAIAVWLRLDDDSRITAIRIAAGAVADRPVLLTDAAEALLAGETPDTGGRIAAGEIDPAGTLHAPANYQRHLVSVLVPRALERAVRRARPDGSGRRDGSRQDSRRIPHGYLPRTAQRRSGDRLPAGCCSVNGRPFRLDGVPDRRLLSDFLRHDLGLRGTHVGCEHGVCGACTVRVDGVAVRSCLLLARQAEGAAVDTVEGLAAADDARTLHPLQDAFRRHFALQCGFCTAGILMTAAERLDAAAAGAIGPPDEQEIRQLLSGHLCRCTGYEPIVAAITDAARATATAREDPAS